MQWHHLTIIAHLDSDPRKKKENVSGVIDRVKRNHLCQRAATLNIYCDTPKVILFPVIIFHCVCTLLASELVILSTFRGISVEGWRVPVFHCSCVPKRIRAACGQWGHSHQLWLMGLACSRSIEEASWRGSTQTPLSLRLSVSFVEAVCATQAADAESQRASLKKTTPMAHFLSSLYLPRSCSYQILPSPPCSAVAENRWNER